MINKSRCVTMVTYGKSRCTLSVKAFIDGSILEQVNVFYYLGKPINDRQDSGKMCRRLISRAKGKFPVFSEAVQNLPPNRSFKVNKRLSQTLVVSACAFGSEICGQNARTNQLQLTFLRSSYTSGQAPLKMPCTAFRRTITFPAIRFPCS